MNKTKILIDTIVPVGQGCRGRMERIKGVKHIGKEGDIRLWVVSTQMQYNNDILWNFILQRYIMFVTNVTNIFNLKSVNSPVPR